MYLLSAFYKVPETGITPALSCDYRILNLVEQMANSFCGACEIGGGIL